MKIAIIILAAGASRRMGSPKQLLPLGNTTLLGHVLRSALEADCGPVTVILGANAARVRESLPVSGYSIVENPDWSSGIGSSIAYGITRVEELIPEPDAALILLADQPGIRPEMIRQFCEGAQSEPGRIIAAAYDGTIGVPALFPRMNFSALKTLDSAKGAKPLLQRLRAESRLIHLTENPDIDTQEEYQELVDLLGNF